MIVKSIISTGEDISLPLFVTAIVVLVELFALNSVSCLLLRAWSHAQQVLLWRPPVATLRIHLQKSIGNFLIVSPKSLFQCTLNVTERGAQTDVMLISGFSHLKYRNQAN